MAVAALELSKKRTVLIVENVAWKAVDSSRKSQPPGNSVSVPALALFRKKIPGETATKLCITPELLMIPEPLMVRAPVSIDLKAVR